MADAAQGARLLFGDCIERMAELEAESVDAVVCDPPYGIEFMGKDWDKFVPHDEVEMAPRWARAERADPATANWSDSDGRYGKLPSYGGRRSSFQCQTCGKRDAFRNPHSCGDDADWRAVPSYAGASPDVLAFERFSEAWAAQAYRVLKPGGHLLAFGAPRMYHRLTAGIEDAGFEIRDSLHWIYGSGFPKSLDVALAIDNKAGEVRPDRGTARRGTNQVLNPTYHTAEKGEPVTAEAQEWEGWGTGLKPAHEPIVLARKPLSGTVSETVLAHGTGAINVAAARVGVSGWTEATGRVGKRDHTATSSPGNISVGEIDAGRWPSNVVLSHLPSCKGNGPHHTDVLCAPGCPVAGVNEMSGECAGSRSLMPLAVTPGNAVGGSHGVSEQATVRGHDDTGGAARFFYVSKPRRRERIGGTIRNLHPTVKPIELMRYLVRLVTPPGGLVLDPFLGSGTTGCAAMAEGFRFVGIENDAESYAVARDRIGDWAFANGRPRPA